MTHPQERPRPPCQLTQVLSSHSHAFHANQPSACNAHNPGNTDLATRGSACRRLGWPSQDGQELEDSDPSTRQRPGLPPQLPPVLPTFELHLCFACKPAPTWALPPGRAPDTSQPQQLGASPCRQVRWRTQLGTKSPLPDPSTGSGPGCHASCPHMHAHMHATSMLCLHARYRPVPLGAAKQHSNPNS
jgi:hypothetical protein